MKEPKIYILHENDEWTQYLIHWLDRKNVPYEAWNLAEGVLDLQKEPPKGIFYNRMSASSHTRGHRYSPEFTDNLIDWLVFHGRVVVNGPEAVKLEVSKIKQYISLNASGIKTPETVAVLGKEKLLEGARQLNNYPLLTKHNRAGRGLGIHLFDLEAALKDYVDSPAFEPSADGITLLQQYINPKNGRINRSEFIGGQFLYTVSIDSSDGFQLCPADNCQLDGRPEQLETSEKFVIVDPLPDQQRIAYENFLKSSQIDVAAIEWVEDEWGNQYVYDVNTNTNYNSKAEEVAGIYAHEHLADYLSHLLKEHYPSPAIFA